MNDWTIPSYVYDENATLGSLFSQFLAANDNDVERFTEAMGLRDSTLPKTWAGNIYTQLLTTRYRAAFEELTCIDFEWLFMIEAKLSLKEKLRSQKTLETTDRVLARLVRRCPDLSNQIRFDTYQSRLHVVEEIRSRIETYTGANLGVLFGFGENQIKKWLKGDNLPANTNLERALAFVLAWPAEILDADIRFALLGDCVIGPNYQAILHASDVLSGFLALHHGDEDKPPSYMERRYQMKHHAYQRLRDYRPGNGISNILIADLMRALLIKQGHKKRLVEFDRLFKEYNKQFIAREITIEPMNWDEEVLNVTDSQCLPQIVTPAVDLSTIHEPTPANIPSDTPCAEKVQVQDVDEPKAPSDSSFPVTPKDSAMEELVQPLAAHALAAAILALRSQLHALTHLQPAYTDDVLVQEALRIKQSANASPQVLVPTVVPPPPVEESPPLVRTPTQEEPIKKQASKPSRMGIFDALDHMLRFKGPMTQEEMNQIIQFIALVRNVLIERVCRLPESQRADILRQVGNPLEEIYVALHAAGTREPEGFLRMMGKQREAGSLLR